MYGECTANMRPAPRFLGHELTHAQDDSGLRRDGDAGRRLTSLGGAGLGLVHHTCFGFTGTFKTGTTVQHADWNWDDKTDECFGIAPDRTIWHAYRTSGGWLKMPHNSRADDTLDTVNTDGETYYIIVYVASPLQHALPRPLEPVVPLPERRVLSHPASP
jgi:hypothetical protein